ncbi:DNA gyrase subunit A [Candidatus Woesearchaeota archaeon]|nr:DNA gyrase subunit A [Candidatus Woesearchaeota archaeon]
MSQEKPVESSEKDHEQPEVLSSDKSDPALDVPESDVPEPDASESSSGDKNPDPLLPTDPSLGVPTITPKNEVYEDNTKYIPKIIEEEMKSSYMEYAMSVIIGRALPDVRDGFKPVHRRVLFAMKELGLVHNKSYKKSARVVGEVLGKYHPHGDRAVYDTAVRMTQAFSLRYPLIQGQGNFGSVDGDNAAAMRYTEMRLSKIADEMLSDIDKDTVDFVNNFDESLKEPSVLPAKLPNLLVNGSSGIAVGMATNMPPHNLPEVVDGVIKYIDNPDIEILDLVEDVQGPDFPTGGIICGRSGLRSAYVTGRGKVKVRAKIEQVELKNKKALIVTEIPYMVNKAELIMAIADKVKDKTIEGISDLRDESDRDGMRIVIELKRDANPELVMNQLYKHSRMQTTFGMNMLALVGNEPRLLNLKQIIGHFVDHRKEVTIRRIQFDLRKAEERSHILAGLIIALEDIDNIIKKIKQSKDTAEAKEVLMLDYDLSELQAKAILDMKLQKLASLEQEKIKTEQEDLIKKITEYKEILGDESRIFEIIKDELIELRSTYGDERRTQILDIDDDIDIEDLIKEEDVVVTVSNAGYVKRIPIDTYRMQRRGGRGVKAADTKEEDFVEHIFIANTHNYILFFTDKGQVHWLKVYQIPEGGRTSRGKAIINLIEIEPDDRIQSYIPVHEFKEGYLLMATKKGIVKKTELMAYSHPRKGGIIAINLEEGDKLIRVLHTSGQDQIIIATKNGQSVKFNERDVRSVGRNSIGVRGIKLKGDDRVIGMDIGDDTKTLLTVTENGYGKRTDISDYRLIKRGGSGVINIKCTERNGGVVSIKTVDENMHLMFITRKGIVIRTPVSGISIIGRNTQGVRLMKLDSEDVVISATRIVEDEEDPVGDSEETDKDSKNVTDDLIEDSQHTTQEGNEEHLIEEGQEEHTTVQNGEDTTDEYEDSDDEEDGSGIGDKINVNLRENAKDEPSEPSEQYATGSIGNEEIDDNSDDNIGSNDTVDDKIKSSEESDDDNIR